jgi:hypothetical protein
MTPRYRIDEGIKDYATDVQKKLIDAVNTHRSVAAAARALKLSASTVRDGVYAAEKKAALCGYAPSRDMTHPVPEPFMVKGVSTYYDDEGKVRGQWVKSKLDDSKVEQLLRDFVSSLIQDVKGTSKLVPAPKVSNADLLAVYPIGDPHFGLYSWQDEAGADFDTAIAERLTTGAIDRLVAAAPPAHTAIVVPLGDIMHADDAKNRTPQSGHVLDVDTRHQKVMLVALRAVKHCVHRALEKHPLVVVRVERGNHDPHAAFAIALALSEHFANNPRVKVDLSPSKFWYYRFGKVLIGVTHGDTAKQGDLLGVMASDRAEDWGKTKFRYWYHGHLHTSGVLEKQGVLIEWFRTLAPRDAWATETGYRSGRDMYCIVHHREFGEIERHRCDVAMIQEATA